LQILFIFIDIADIHFCEQIEGTSLLVGRGLLEDLGQLSRFALEEERHDHEIGIIRIDGIQHIEGIQHAGAGICLLIVHLVEAGAVITVKSVMDQGVLAVGQVLDQPVAVAPPVEGLPAIDIPSIGALLTIFSAF